ncbi:unnamed protein product [Rhizoctonia solani]|uniref:Caspase family p20 domain-containing protein n=1 Tax=Rhizoctonia solani TaxID=456999 RepID=A0A8H3GA02_9AGAM|nr:unnamed protein product [Rhizoctonia solani]
MQTFTPVISYDSPNNQTMIDPLSANVQSSNRRRLSIIKYRGFLDTFLPRGPRRSLEVSNVSSSMPRHSSHISSLAAATLLGLSQAQRISPLVEAAGASLEGILAIRRSGQYAPIYPFDHYTQPSRQSDSPTPSSEKTLCLGVNNQDSGQLTITPASNEFTSDTGKPNHTIENVPDISVAAANSDIPPPSPDSNRNRVTFVLPKDESDAFSPPMDGVGTDVNITPTSIPLHMRSFRRFTRRTNSTSSSFIHNRKLVPEPPNGSASSLLTTSTYATAPTGTSPPHSLRSLPRCESPGPLPDIYRRTRVHSFQTSSLRESIAFSDFAHDTAGVYDDVAERFRPEKPRSVYNVGHLGLSSRKLLIIGNPYKECGEVKRMFSIGTLNGVYEDRDQLTRVFKERGYSVETLFEESFDKEGAMARVARFLDDANAGDIRAIVFTGHGYPHEDGTVSLIPPKCPQKSDAITCVEWDQNIQNHSRPGTVVLSIMAHCFSGRVMKQAFDHQQWETLAPTDEIRDGPTYLTFAASSQGAYESWVTRDSILNLNRASDHFIYALVHAIQSIDVTASNWTDFFKAFDCYFQRARSCASWQDKQVSPSVPNWRLINGQTPSFTASRLVRPSAIF